MSSDEEIVCVRKKKVVVADSSDENDVSLDIVNELNVSIEVKVSEPKINEEREGQNALEVSLIKDEKNQRKKKRIVKTFDSSSESEEDISNSKSEDKKSVKSSHKSKDKDRKNIFDKDNKSIKNINYSEDENIEAINKEPEREKLGLSTNLESAAVPKNLWYNNSDLYDAEGSSDEGREIEEWKSTGDNEDDDPVNLGSFHTESSSKKKEKEPSKRAERKSKKKAQEDIKADIHRESQRLLRQVPISIPYHRPKQRSLADFLVRRKLKPKVPLQASSEELVTALKEIEQREKEAELFYKSDSSEEDEVQNTKYKSKSNSGNEIHTEHSEASVTKEQDLESVTNVHKDDLKSTENLGDDLSNIEKPGKIENDTKSNTITANETIFTNDSAEQDDKLNTEYVATEEENSILIKESNKLNNLNCNTILAKESELIANELNTTGSLNDHSKEQCQTHVEENGMKNQGYMNFSNTYPIKCTQSKAEINNSSSSFGAESPTNPETSCNLINTEDFSLKLSESQPFDSSENQLVQELSCNKNKGVDLDNPIDNSSVKEASGVSKCNKYGVLDNETEGENCKQDGTEVKGELKKEESHDESNVEKELFKKYNVEVKNVTVNSPKIIGANDEMIDLEEGIPKPEVDQLMKRFLTHLSYKKKQKKKVAVELSVVSAERDAEGRVSGISEESVRLVVGEGEEEEDPSLARPGAKLALLRATLQQEMVRRREQEWAKRMEEVRMYEDEEVFEGEKDVCDGLEDEEEKNEDDETKNEMEEEEEEEEDEETEVEEDETDEEETEKRKPKSVFLDDEAEESDEEPSIRTSYKNKEENIDNSTDDGGDDDDNEGNDSSVDNDVNEKENNTEKTEVIAKEDPGKIENKKGPQSICDFFIKRPSKPKPGLPRTRTTSDMFSSSQEAFKCSTDEEELPSFQKPRSLEDKEEVEEKLSETPSITSPAFQLTALENMDVASKYNWSAPSTPCKDFLSPKIITPVRAVRANLVDKSPQVCTQELEDMCSGNFSSQPLPQDSHDEDFQLFLAEDSQLERDQVTPVKSSSVSGKKHSGEKLPAELFGDDEDEPPPKVPVKKAKKLNFSDDEDEGDGESQEADDEGDDDEGDEEGEEAGEVEYDSEENEVEVASSVVAKAGEYLDAEAELSEEEWSSEDEDERGLDTLEMEEADREKIDERRLKRQLGKIHMQEMLKEDKKQVRLLQEMLLEDGELHSDSKRQRLFRWSNNAAFTEGDNKAVLDSDDEKADDDEDEENWRKSRHERELFLQEQSKKSQRLEELDLGEESDSQLLRLGQRALRRLSSNGGSQERAPATTPAVPTLSNPLASPDAKRPFMLPKRGSFLSRGQQTLSRLAQMVSSASDGPIQQPKNSRKFVFTTISPTKGEQEEAKPTLVSNKRKLPHLPLPIAKKPCVQKPKTANKKSLFEALTRVNC